MSDYTEPELEGTYTPLAGVKPELSEAFSDLVDELEAARRTAAEETARRMNAEAEALAMREHVEELMQNLTDLRLELAELRERMR